MNQKQIAYHLKTLHRLVNVPIVYNSQEGMKYFQPFTLSTSENELDFISSRLQRVFDLYHGVHAVYYVHPSMVMLGIVAKPESGEFVFIGPIASASATEKSIADYLFESGLSADTTRKMTDYLNSIKPISPEQFQELIVNINLAVNDEILSKHELVALYASDDEQKREYMKKKLKAEEPLYEPTNTALVELYNEKLNYCIMHGDLDGLSDLLNDMAGVPFKESNLYEMSLRKSRIVAFGSVFAAETIALKSGISSADLERTKEYYLDRIDNAKSQEEHRKLAVSALFDFTKLVKEALVHKTDNPTVNRVIDYIKTNINSKLLADDIASALNINSHYLFTKFKEETGKTLTQYINEMKVQKACYYLLFTDKSLIDIAMHLSFSSQSYFQTIFKKIKNYPYRVERTK